MHTHTKERGDSSKSIINCLLKHLILPKRLWVALSCVQCTGYIHSFCVDLLFVAVDICCLVNVLVIFFSFSLVIFCFVYREMHTTIFRQCNTQQLVRICDSFMRFSIVPNNTQTDTALAETLNKTKIKGVWFLFLFLWLFTSLSKNYAYTKHRAHTLLVLLYFSTTTTATAVVPFTAKGAIKLVVAFSWLFFGCCSFLCVNSHLWVSVYFCICGTFVDEHLSIHSQISIQSNIVECLLCFISSFSFFHSFS